MYLSGNFRNMIMNPWILGDPKTLHHLQWVCCNFFTSTHWMFGSFPQPIRCEEFPRPSARDEIQAEDFWELITLGLSTWSIWELYYWFMLSIKSTLFTSIYHHTWWQPVLWSTFVFAWVHLLRHIQSNHTLYLQKTIYWRYMPVYVHCRWTPGGTTVLVEDARTPEEPLSPRSTSWHLGRRLVLWTDDGISIL